MNYSLRIGQYHRYSCSIQSYFALVFIIIACLLLKSTNANNQTDHSGDVAQTIVKTIKTYVGDILTENHDGLSRNATNQTHVFNESESLIQMLNQPLHMSQMRWLLQAFLRLLAQLIMIFGGVIPYFPQYAIIKRTQNAEGFSNYVCLTLLIANILRIEFWFGKHFEIPLLLQSIVMILCMLIMLELWTRVHAKSLRHRVPSDLQVITASKEQLNEEPNEMKFTDFKVEYFWRWTTFRSYIQFLLLITLLLSTITWILINNEFYVETIGLMAVLCEALLGIPQFVRNFLLKSTEGMSVKMVLLWTSGDIFKTVYFILRSAPKQFWLCGILQISIDVAILGQVVFYSKKYRCCKP